MIDLFTVFDGSMLSGTAVLYSITYIIGGWLIMVPPFSKKWKLALFAIFNLFFLYVVYFSSTTALSFRLLIYILFGCFHFALVHLLCRSEGKSQFLYWLVLLTPLFLLLYTKVNLIVFLGLSYLAFRLSYLAYEIRGKKVKTITIEEYFAFALFLPIISIGPISPFKFFQDSFAVTGNINIHNIYHGLLRVGLGLIKFALLAPIPQELIFSALFTDGLTHNWFDFFLAGFAFLLYLYLNFSGFIDVVIGGSALLGIKVKENFDNPFVSTSILDFWNRWHISLSEYVRDIFYTPITMTLTRKLGITLLPLWASIAAFITFLILGYWHGNQIGWIIFGLLHGAAFTVNVLWGMFLDGRMTFKRRLQKNAAWKVLSIFMTLAYVSMTMFFIDAPTLEQMKPILDIMKESGML